MAEQQVDTRNYPHWLITATALVGLLVLMATAAPDGIVAPAARLLGLACAGASALLVFLALYVASLIPRFVGP